MRMRVGILTGTRPDIIKDAPLYWEAKKRGHEPVLIHTTQHWSHELFEGVYKDLEMKFPPDYMLEFGQGHSIASGVAKMISEIDHLLRKDEPNLDVLLVHGDTTTCMAGALAAHLNCVPVGHVEAGLRTFSREPFPEQTDTRTTDACSDIYFAATELNAQNLVNEGFRKDRIFTVGNTVVDVARWAAKRGPREKDLVESIMKGKKKPIYFTVHRRENTIHDFRFKAIIDAVVQASEMGYDIILSMLPGTRNALNKYGLMNKIYDAPNIRQVEKLPNYSDVIYIIQNSHIVLTDSGGMQEESAALNIPCITARYVTDRPESVDAGVNILAPPDSPETIVKAIEKADAENGEMRKKKNPYGEGDSSKKIFDILEKFEGKMIAWEHDNGAGACPVREESKE